MTKSAIIDPAMHLHGEPRIVLFFRGAHFYPVVLTPRCKIEDHVLLNPGTTKVEDAATGEVLWPVTLPEWLAIEKGLV